MQTLLQTAIRDSWIGIVEVSPLPGCDLFSETANAFINVVGLANSREQFSAAVDAKCRAMKLHVHELKDTEPCATRFEGKIVPKDIEIALRTLTTAQPVEFGTFFLYDVE